MSPVSYQTIKLSKGKHASPDDGACVMELASMLAGEPFTDHPASVCPVIASFLRSYNDSIDEVRRQSLYECASKVVGSRAGQRIQQARVERLAEWADEVLRARPMWFLRSPLRALTRLRKAPIDAIGPYAVHTIPRHTDESHRAVLALVDELLLTGVRDDRVSARVIAARSRALDTAA
jgi:hypothetical protein